MSMILRVECERDVMFCAQYYDSIIILLVVTMSSHKVSGCLI